MVTFSQIPDFRSTVVEGATGDDVLSGYPGNDTLIGGAGIDTFSACAAGAVIHGGGGNDYVYLAARPRSILALATIRSP